MSQSHLSIPGQEPAGRAGSQLTTVPGNRGGVEGKVWGLLLQATTMTLRPQGQPVAPPFPACLTESEMHAALAPSRVGKLGYASQVQFSQQLPCSIGITANGQDSISPF